MAATATEVKDVPMYQSFYLIPKGYSNLLAPKVKEGRGVEPPPCLYRDITGQLREEGAQSEFNCPDPSSYRAVWKNRKIHPGKDCPLLGSPEPAILSAFVLDMCLKGAVEIVRKKAGTNDPFFWVQGASEQLYPANQWVFGIDGEILDINEEAVKEWYEYEKKIKSLIRSNI